MASTHLYEQAREIVLEHFGLHKDRYTVIFCSPGTAELLGAQLRPGSHRIVSSGKIGLPLGLGALAAERRALPGVVRASLGIENGAKEMDALVQALGEIAHQPRAGAREEVRRRMDDFVWAPGRRVDCE